MKLLRRFLDLMGKPFEKGRMLAPLRPLYEATDNFMYSPGTVTKGPPHVRDFMDLKRLMIVVYIALLPACFMALYNTGLQANAGLAAAGAETVPGWRGTVMSWLEFEVATGRLFPEALGGMVYTFLGLTIDLGKFLADLAHGALYFLPVYIVTLAAGGLWEVVFAVVRKHQISEGFLVTSILFPLILPASIPLWQVAVGISFGVVVGKEVFGGVGMNILNPALTARCFLYFAYPGEISGDQVWVAVDGMSKATPLGELANMTLESASTFKDAMTGMLPAKAVSYWDAFLGIMPGSMGETSVLACLIGAVILIATRVGSWRIMLGTVVGMVGLSFLFNIIGSSNNALFSVSPWWHLALGGFAFGTVFMATDPVSAAHTLPGQYIYGLLIGVLTVLVRVVNSGFPEGIMLAILFMNVFAPAIDKIFIAQNVKRRQLRNAQ